MTNAVTVTGRLGDEVPRPIQYGGLVTAWIVGGGKSSDTSTGRERPWHWTAQARVKQDGSFVLEGIPADSLLQLTVVSKSWSNKAMSLDLIHGARHDQSR